MAKFKIEPHADGLTILQLRPSGEVRAHLTIAIEDVEPLVDALLHAKWVKRVNEPTFDVASEADEQPQQADGWRGAFRDGQTKL